MSASPDGTPAPSPLWTLREYRFWLAREVFSDIGNSIGAFAFPLVTLAVTGSATATGVVGFAEGAGGLLGLLPGGILADRHNRQRLALLSSVLAAAAQALLVALLLGGWASLVTLAALAAVDRFRAMLLGQSSEAMLKQIVPPRQLARAAAVNEGRDAAISLGAGPVGGFLLAIGLFYPALVQLVGSACAAVMTLVMRGAYRPRAADAAPTSVLSDVREAGHWVASQPERRDLMVVSALVNLGINGVIVTVTLALALRGVPAAHIGLLGSTIAAAVLVGALAADWAVEHIPTGRIIVGVLFLLGLGASVIPFLSSIWWIGVAYAVMGFGIPVVNAALQGYFVHITPMEMQGRVGALTGLVSMGLMPLAPGLGGWGLGTIGARPTMIGFAMVCVAGALLVLRSRPLRAIPAAAGWESHASSTA